MLTAQSTTETDTDGIGRVVDFSVLKERVGGWVEDKWDHGFILHEDDDAGWAAMAVFSQESGVQQKVATIGVNPTAENMANHLLRAVGPLVLEDTGVELVAVRLWETENCYADATL